MTVLLKQVQSKVKEGSKTFISGILLIIFTSYILTDHYSKAIPFLVLWVLSFFIGNLASIFLFYRFSPLLRLLGGVFLGFIEVLLFSFFYHLTLTLFISCLFLSGALGGYLSLYSSHPESPFLPSKTRLTYVLALFAFLSILFGIISLISYLGFWFL